jgi:hypothetical protein
VRAPLRIAAIGETDLRNLSDDSFSGGSRSMRNDDE